MVKRARKGLGGKGKMAKTTGQNTNDSSAERTGRERKQNVSVV